MPPKKESDKDDKKDPKWRESLAQEDRQKLINKLAECLKECVPPTAGGNEAEQEAKFMNFAVKFETSVYNTAEGKEEYFHCIAMRMYKLKKNMTSKPEEASAQSSGSNTPIEISSTNHAPNSAANPISIMSPGPTGKAAKTPGTAPQSFKAPTPATNAATPNASVPSPAPATPYSQILTPSITPHTPQAMSEDEQDKFWEQLNSMKRFIEPLGRMLSRMKKKGGSTGAKLEFIYKLISETREKPALAKKINLGILLKCEEQLERYLGALRSPATTPVNFAVPTPTQGGKGESKDTAPQNNIATQSNDTSADNTKTDKISVSMLASPSLPPSGPKKLASVVLQDLVKKLTTSVFSCHVIRDAFMGTVMDCGSFFSNEQFYDGTKGGVVGQTALVTKVNAEAEKAKEGKTEDAVEKKPATGPTKAKKRKGLWFQEDIVEQSMLLRGKKNCVIYGTQTGGPSLGGMGGPRAMRRVSSESGWEKVLPKVLQKELINLKSGFSLKFDKATINRAMEVYNLSAESTAHVDNWEIKDLRRSNVQWKEGSLEGLDDFKNIVSKNTLPLQGSDGGSREASNNFSPQMGDKGVNCLEQEEILLWVSLDKTAECVAPIPPEIGVMIPAGYPGESPVWHVDASCFAVTGYLSDVLSHLEASLTLLPAPYSLTQFLDALSEASTKSLKGSPKI
eukprot:Nk52_evm4s335 gene=Nk52_evmTU4s335